LDCERRVRGEQRLEGADHRAGHCQRQHMAGADEAAVGVRTPPAELALVDDCHRPAVAGQVVGAGGADDSAADDDDLTAHVRIPIPNGSAGSSSSVASALTWAEPRTRGTTRPSISRIDPSKTLPTMLSCRQTCPSFSLPSANRHASLALV